MNYPEYRKVNEAYPVAVLTDDLSPSGVATVIRNVMEDEALRSRLASNCEKAREVFCWQSEEEKLISFYQRIFAS
jgi:hypothetical protein